MVRDPTAKPEVAMAEQQGFYGPTAGTSSAAGLAQPSQSVESFTIASASDTPDRPPITLQEITEQENLEWIWFPKGYGKHHWLHVPEAVFGSGDVR